MTKMSNRLPSQERLKFVNHPFFPDLIIKAIKNRNPMWKAITREHYQIIQMSFKSFDFLSSIRYFKLFNCCVTVNGNF